MWERIKSGTTDFTTGGRLRRRGAKLGLLIAVMVTLPGLVAATEYISGSSSGTLTSGTANVQGAVCGWWKDTNIDSMMTASSISGTYSLGGSVAPTSGTISVTANVVDSATYEYLIDEIVWGCEDTPATGTISVSFATLSSATVTGATQAVVMYTTVEPDAAQNPTTTGGTACAGSLYLPAATATTNIAATSAYTWSAIGGASVSGCGSLSATTLGLTIPNGITTDTGYVWISYAILVSGSTGLSASAAFTMPFTVTVA